jgi:hypothetical protein
MPPSKPVACDDNPSDILPAGNLKLSVALDPTTVWQPRGGDVKFTITGTGFTPENIDIVACFRWKADSTAEWHKSPSLRRIDNGTVAGAVSFAATVPVDLPAVQSWWLQRLIGYADKGASTGLFLVPIADLRVMAKSVATSPPAWSPLDVTTPVGITSPIFSVFVTVLLVVIAGYSLFRFGQLRGVPGGKDVILTIISTKGGYASLSQLQIILWSFVIGAGAVYVMSLAGNLIAITQGTLVLLGISGVATIASKLQSYSETRSAPPTPPIPPTAGLPPAAATAAPRIPQWSDLVIASDGQNEIDVTRVQMLFFTVIVALFVTLRILASGEIPEIPEGYLGLMGISNGVYVTAKFIPS